MIKTLPQLSVRVFDLVSVWDIRESKFELEKICFYIWDWVSVVVFWGSL